MTSCQSTTPLLIPRLVVHGLFLFLWLLFADAISCDDDCISLQKNTMFRHLQNHMIVRFLLAMCAECIAHEKDPLKRSHGVDRVVSIIVEYTTVSIETILRHPYRMRYFLLTGLSDRTYWRTAPTSVPTLMDSDDIVMKHLFHCASLREAVKSNCGDGGKQGDVSSRNKMKYGCVEELVPWEMVTDEAVGALILSEITGPCKDEESDYLSCSFLLDKRLTARRRNILRVTRRMAHCGLNVSGSQCSQDGSHRVWSLLGVAMIAEHLFTSRCTSTGGLFESHRLQAVFSTPHLWATFYPMLFSLLRNPTLSSVEGLRLASSLGK